MCEDPGEIRDLGRAGLQQSGARRHLHGPGSTELTLLPSPEGGSRGPWELPHQAIRVSVPFVPTVGHGAHGRDSPGLKILTLPAPAPLLERDLWGSQPVLDLVPTSPSIHSSPSCLERRKHTFVHSPISLHSSPSASLIPYLPHPLGGHVTTLKFPQIGWAESPSRRGPAYLGELLCACWAMTMTTKLCI